MINFKNKKILITGATGGIGGALVKKFVALQGNVLATGTKVEKLDLLKKENPSIKVKKFDIADHSNIQEFVENVSLELGGIDILINNAGISIPTLINDENYEEYWDKTFNVLLKAQVQLIRETLPYIQKSESGRIVNISSTEGLGATPRQSPYTSAKHGVIGLTKSLAVELGSTGITINCICPGPIRTGMTEKISEEDKNLYAKRRVPLKRYGEPEEVAQATLNFCLPSSSFINGAVLPVDGGLTIKRA